MSRPSWDEYFLKIAQVVSERATCLRAKHGAVIIDENNKILSTGYNGAPKGMPHCEEVGCLIVEDDDGPHCHRTFHAEENALKHLRLDDKPYTIYVTGTCCPICLNLILRYGIKHIICGKPYGEFSQHSQRLLDVFGATLLIKNV